MLIEHRFVTPTKEDPQDPFDLLVVIDGPNNPTTKKIRLNITAIVKSKRTANLHLRSTHGLIITHNTMMGHNETLILSYREDGTGRKITLKIHRPGISNEVTIKEA